MLPAKIILLFALLGVLPCLAANNKCSDVFGGESTRNAEERLAAILGTTNEHFYPKNDYNQLFAKAITEFEPTPENFREALDYFLKVRIKIARGNRNDRDLLAALKSESAQKHFLGKSRDMTNVTSIYAESLYGDLSIRYKELYGLLESRRREGRFNTPDHNELIIRRNKQAKDYETKPSPENSWWLHYEDIDGSGTKRLISGIIMKTDNVSADGIALYGIYNSFSRDVPKIVKHLERLWKRALIANSQREKVAAIAEFEWFFFQSNPLTRAAASIGDVMSLNLQYHLGLPMRTEFKHLDFYALTMTKDEYIEWRLNQ